MTETIPSVCHQACGWRLSWGSPVLGCQRHPITLQTRRFSHCSFCPAAWGTHWESSDPQPDERLPTSRSLPGPRHTTSGLYCFHPSSQTHPGCLSLPIPSDPSAPPHRCWTLGSGRYRATKPQIPKKGQIPPLAVVHPWEQMLLLPRKPTYLPYLLSHGSDKPQASWFSPRP